jgi:hypothetical protein
MCFINQLVARGYGRASFSGYRRVTFRAPSTALKGAEMLGCEDKRTFRYHLRNASHQGFRFAGGSHDRAKGDFH